MYFLNTSEVFDIARRSGCSIFVLPETEAGALVEPKPDRIVLQPEEKSIITIEQVKTVISRLSVKQLEDVFVVISPADLLGEEASNALLKNLEEPKEKVHFVLITDSISKILPTILSRAAVYFLKTATLNFDEIRADEKVKGLAKKLIAAKPADLPALADELTPKGKDKVRGQVLEILSVAVEMLYKSYLKTGKEAFLAKVPKYITAYENIEKNGHIKLHLVADLL